MGKAKITFADVTPLDDVLRRICAEYAEMPGLRVTQQQGQRLWALDPQTCVRALDALIEAGFLRRTPSNEYVRVSEGPPTFPARHQAQR
jgi:hypothetical protein